MFLPWQLRCPFMPVLGPSLHSTSLWNHFLSVLYLLNRLSDFYHFFIKIISKMFPPWQLRCQFVPVLGSSLQVSTLFPFCIIYFEPLERFLPILIQIISYKCFFPGCPSVHLCRSSGLLYIASHWLQRSEPSEPSGGRAECERHTPLLSGGLCHWVAAHSALSYARFAFGLGKGSP